MPTTATSSKQPSDVASPADESLGLTIRLACHEDAATIYAIHKSSLTTLCQTHYPLSVLQTWFAAKTIEGYYPVIQAGQMFVAEMGQVMVGFGEAILGEIVALFVHPDFARRGVGTHLLRYAIACAQAGGQREIKLSATLNAQAFYAKHGFREVQRVVVTRGGVELPLVEMVLTDPAGEALNPR